MASSIGSGPSEIKQDWQELGSFGHEFADAQMILRNMIGANLWELSNFEERLAGLQEAAIEQATAIELRKKFGIPLSLLATPVFIELEKIEADSRIKLKEGSLFATKMWEQVTANLLNAIKIFLFEQIAKIEDEKEAHELALNSARKEAEGRPDLSETILSVEEKIKIKIADLEKKKTSLILIFTQVMDNAVEKPEKIFHTTIFEASMQNTKTSLIQ